jgi:hypothetical protein
MIFSKNIIIMFMTVSLIYFVGSSIFYFQKYQAQENPTYCEQNISLDNTTYIEEIKIMTKLYDNLYDQYASCNIDLAECQAVLYEDIMSITPESIEP